jgi:glycerophosphoryl diester phosphodiesterase
VARPAGACVSTFACAHRGLSGEVAENTLAAFQAAIQAGFPALECDLRATADGEVVVLHDAGVERTTHGSGRVADMRYDELRRHPTSAGPVPRLDDVLAATHDWHGLWNLEIKALAATNGAIHLLEHHHALGHAQISSMDARALESARTAAPDLPRGLITLGPLSPEEVDLARDLECRWINADHGFLDGKAVDLVHDAGLRLAAWTVNDAKRAQELSKLGVECVITDTRAVHEALRGSADPKPYF